MKVTLVSTTPNAADVLLFTKSTRLTMSPGLMDEIRAWPAEKKAEELKYMANTIPSSWEFVDYVFLVEGVSRAYTHQQVRTRAGSYAQQTMRVLEMGDYDYVKSDRILASPSANATVDEVNGIIRQAYKLLTSIGIPAEDARGILPTNIATNIVCKFNLRTLAELARSRTGGRTQGEYQKVVNAMIDAVLAVHPWASDFLFPKGRNLFDEIEAWAMKEFPDNLMRRGEVLKIVDRMRKELQ
jgi:flavin-dependent thymidylate synthase